MILSVSECKAFRNIPNDVTEHDSELERLIAVVQTWLENECGRKFDDSGVTPLAEYYSGDEWRSQLVVARPPIIGITDIQVDNNRNWDQPTVPAANFAVYDADAGIIKLINYRFPLGVMNIRVQYRGGFSNSTMPADLKQAAIEMVWANRMKGENNLIGVRSRGLADGSVQYVNLDWPMNLQPIIDKYCIKRKLQGAGGQAEGGGRFYEQFR
jgi:hypothetical protein